MEVEPVTATAPAPPDPWKVEFERLRARFRAPDSVLFCIHAMQQDDNILFDDLRLWPASTGCTSQLHR